MTNGRRDPESVLTVAQAARRLNVSTKKIYRMCQAGEIVHCRVGDAIRITPGDLEDISPTPVQWV